MSVKLKSTRSKQFMDRLESALSNCIWDSGLTISIFTKKIGMSRTDLHRKMIAVTGMSISAYIRKKRIEKAAKLLLENDEYTIYQIALEVGFSNHSYFSERFKEFFLISPREYRQQFLEH